LISQRSIGTREDRARDIRGWACGPAGGFSTVWKKVFHGVEKSGLFFPRHGKFPPQFSTLWKTFFHTVEKPDALGEEIAHAVSHGVGALLAIAGLAVLMVAAATRGEGAWQVVPCVIYGAAMVLMFTTSTLYHSFPWPRVKRVFRVLDHEMIFLMIAGSYTPFMLITLRGALGWTLFGVVWGIAAAGMVFQGFFTGRFKGASTALYLVMGWIIVFALKPLLDEHVGGGGALAGGGRAVLHAGGGGVSVQARAVPPCGLAPGGAGGRRLPLFRHPLARAAVGGSRVS
jgi:hemolysin III